MPKYTTTDRLNQIMRERGLRQVDIVNLAKPYCEKYKVKIGRNDISQYVNGKAVPRQNKIFVLSLALNVSESWLMGYDVDPERKNATPSDVTDDDINLASIIKDDEFAYAMYNEGKNLTEAQKTALLNMAILFKQDIENKSQNE